jgi:NTP pyrophosphatase (non-canonical NTP hydrolase)
MDDTAVWTEIERLHSWLESANTAPRRELLLLRMLKLSEEVGEVAEAVIGAVGQNPRKGHSHDWADVEAELCDVVLTAMVALRTLTPDAPQVFAAHLRKVAERASGMAGESGRTGPGRT